MYYVLGPCTISCVVLCCRAVHGGALCARAVCCMVMHCTVSYSGVPVGVLRGVVAYCVVGWFTLC